MDGFSGEQAGVRGSGASWGMRVGDALLFVVVVASFYQKSKAGESQPVPYDFMLIATMGLYYLFGLRIPRGLAWPVTLWGLVLIGYGIGGMSATYMDKVQNALPVTAYLVCTIIFFASVIYEAPARRLRLIFNAYAVGATIAAAIAVGGYFNLIPNASDYLLFGRATATFNDPNVFGPYLIAPTVYLGMRLSSARSWRALLLALPIIVLLLALLLSFSRAAWGSLLLAGAIFVGVTLMTSQSARQSYRLIIFSACAALTITAVVAVALSTPKVQALFDERATLVQNYDVGEGGRFQSQARAFAMTLERPLGIGQGQWGMINKLDTHNTYISVLVAGGFLSGLAFLGFVVLTLKQGWSAILERGPAQEYLIVAYACIVGHMIEAYIIDVDNWRHLFLLFGVIWGGIAMMKAKQSTASRGRSQAAKWAMPRIEGFQS